MPAEALARTDASVAFGFGEDQTEGRLDISPTIRGMGRPFEQQLPWMRPHITRGCCSPVTDIELRVLYIICTVNTGNLGGPSYEEVLSWKCGACGDACRTCSNGSGHAAPAASSAGGVL